LANFLTFLETEYLLCWQFWSWKCLIFFFENNKKVHYLLLNTDVDKRLKIKKTIPELSRFNSVFWYILIY
jgi:hypothetical protein